MAVTPLESCGMWFSAVLHRHILNVNIAYCLAPTEDKLMLVTKSLPQLYMCTFPAGFYWVSSHSKFAMVDLFLVNSREYLS